MAPFFFVFSVQLIMEDAKFFCCFPGQLFHESFIFSLRPENNKSFIIPVYDGIYETPVFIAFNKIISREGSFCFFVIELPFFGRLLTCEFHFKKVFRRLL